MLQPPVKPHQVAHFTEDVEDVLVHHVSYRTGIDHLVQFSVPIGDLVQSLRQGRYATIVPTSGRRWVIPGRGFEGKLLEWLEETGYRIFRHSRTTYIALPHPAPLPRQAQ